MALLAVLNFLCECGSGQDPRGALFKTQEVRRKLLLLLEQTDFSKPLHLNMVRSSKNKWKYRDVSYGGC